MSGFSYKYIYEIAEKSLQLFEGNMTMSAVITLRELVREFPTINFIMNSSDKLPRMPTSSPPNGHCRKVLDMH
jgi:hypothetical protein